MKAFLKRVGFILVLVVGLSTLISAGNLWALRCSSFYKPSFLVNDIKEKNFDYIILGASTGLTTLNTTIIDSIAHINGLNLSMDDTTLSTHYLMLQHFLAEGKTTSYCILAPSNTSYDLKLDRLSDNAYRFLPYVQRDYVYEHYGQFDSPPAHVLKQSKWLPMQGVSYYNTELFYPSLVSLFNPKKRNRFDAKGNYTYPAKTIDDTRIVSRDTFDVDFSNPYMKAIKALCDRHGIQLICYLSPMERRSVNVVNMDYKSINHSANLTNTRYFFDGIHVNTLGREASSIAFANQFIELKKH